MGGLPTPLVMLCAGGMHSTLLLLPTPCLCSLLFRSGIWAFCIFLSIICPSCSCGQLFLVPYSFFVFCCSRRCVSGASTAAKGPRSQPVSLLAAVRKACTFKGPALSKLSSSVSLAQENWSKPENLLFFQATLLVLSRTRFLNLGTVNMLPG